MLLLDELDAIAKRRDDTGEIGELKRLVTVLLQQLDDWPSTGIPIAATNDAELLDPAIWRRFKSWSSSSCLDARAARAFIKALLHRTAPTAENWSDVLSVVFARHSFSDIERMVNSARRSAALNGKNLDEHRLCC